MKLNLCDDKILELKLFYSYLHDCFLAYDIGSGVNLDILFKYIMSKGNGLFNPVFVKNELERINNEVLK